MIVSALAIYPIKSCRGIAVDEAVVTRRGLAGDRLWMVADESGKLLSQRNEPGLTHVSARFEGGRVVASAAGAADLRLPAGATGPRIEVEVWRYRGPAAVDEAGSAWFSAVLGRRALLVHMPDDVERGLNPLYGQPGDAVGFADAYPLLLTTEESLADVSARVGQAFYDGAASGPKPRAPAEPLAMARFRPNVVVRGAASPYEEDGWRRVTLGDAPLRVAKRCDRCVMITIDPASGARGPEPLRTLAGYREEKGSVYFGVYLAPDVCDVAVRVGDPVSVSERA